MALPSSTLGWVRREYIDKLESQGPFSMPHLPEQRPRPLTPTSFRYEGSKEKSFFDVLPFELRRKILCEAFGNETLHMELDYDHPMVPLKNPTKRHGARNGVFDISTQSFGGAGTWPKNYLRTDKWQPKKWQWWSSVCHQRTTVFDDLWMATEEEPWMDGCQFGNNEYCSSSPGNAPAKCHLGIMGWLLSCRQAYSEGTTVLYRTNNFHLANSELILGLPKLLLPSKLALITSLQLIWKIHPFRGQQPNDPPFSDYRSFLMLTEQTPVIFPQARQLYISLQGDMFVFPENPQLHVIKRGILCFIGDPDMSGPDSERQKHDLIENRALEPVEDMISKFKCLKKCIIAIPSSTYWLQKQRVLANGGQVWELRNDRIEKHWRQLQSREGSSVDGYWLQLGHRDLGDRFLHTTTLHEGCELPGEPEPMDALYGSSCSPW
ncbi:Fc.00g038720.m01.CDS01 [Cosmosporella sp. VM-42]